MPQVAAELPADGSVQIARPRFSHTHDHQHQLQGTVLLSYMGIIPSRKSNTGLCFSAYFVGRSFYLENVLVSKDALRMLVPFPGCQWLSERVFVHCSLFSVPFCFIGI